ncbi:hypothetical protein ACHAW6_003975 [Cyclotella cf. meneghiniana]
MGVPSVPSKCSPTWPGPTCYMPPCIGQTIPSLICGHWPQTMQSECTTNSSNMAQAFPLKSCSLASNALVLVFHVHMSLDSQFMSLTPNAGWQENSQMGQSCSSRHLCQFLSSALHLHAFYLHSSHPQSPHPTHFGMIRCHL